VAGLRGAMTLRPWKRIVLTGDRVYRALVAEVGTVRVAQGPHFVGQQLGERVLARLGAVAVVALDLALERLRVQAALLQTLGDLFRLQRGSQPAPTRDRDADLAKVRQAMATNVDVAVAQRTEQRVLGPGVPDLVPLPHHLPKPGSRPHLLDLRMGSRPLAHCLADLVEVLAMLGLDLSAAPCLVCEPLLVLEDVLVVDQSEFPHALIRHLRLRELLPGHEENAYLGHARLLISWTDASPSRQPVSASDGSNGTRDYSPGNICGQERRAGAEDPSAALEQAKAGLWRAAGRSVTASPARRSPGERTRFTGEDGPMERAMPRME